ncbi:MAG: DUF3857 domain-containing protein [Bacteroidota bacterium]|nr:DUF3857 domain-containing protein [Bacteroidota bacterium]
MKPHFISWFLRLLCAFIIFPIFAYSQAKDRYQFDKVTREELKMPACSFEPDAPAMVLGDKGTINISSRQDYTVIFKRRIRIKIFKKEGVTNGTFEIPLYVNNNAAEDIADIDGYTYNLVNGKIVETELDKSSIFIEKSSKNLRTAKIVLPNVREGSVIDLRYSVYSDFPYEVPSWYFQKDIPTNWSEVVANYDNTFIYSYKIQGCIPFAINYYACKNQSEQYDMAIEYGGYMLAVSKAPSIKADNYMTTVKDYEACFKMELASYIRKDNSAVNFTNSWDDLITKILDNFNFGKQLKKGSFLKEELQKFNKSDDEECIKAIYESVRSKVKWDGNTAIFATDNIDKVYERGSGSTAEINLLLLALLREAGYKADPVLISTRSHGKIQEDYPLLSNFNTVLAYLNLNGKIYLLDASDRHVAFNQLPEKCLNGKGRIMNRNITPGWVDLSRQEMSVETVSTNLALDDKGILKGTVQIAYGGTKAAAIRDQLERKGEEEYFKSIKAEDPNYTFENLSFENLKDPDLRLIENANISTGTPKDNVSTIYIPLIPIEAQKENPFKKEDRIWPVDFPTKVNETISTRIKLDPSYKIEEMPKSITYVLPNNAAIFHCNITYDENSRIIIILSRITINKTQYAPEEYKDLRELFSLITEKHNGQIVLKKVAPSGNTASGS